MRSFTRSWKVSSLTRRGLDRALFRRFSIKRMNQATEKRCRSTSMTKWSKMKELLKCVMLMSILLWWRRLHLKTHRFHRIRTLSPDCLFWPIMSSKLWSMFLQSTCAQNAHHQLFVQQAHTLTSAWNLKTSKQWLTSHSCPKNWWLDLDKTTKTILLPKTRVASWPLFSEAFSGTKWPSTCLSMSGHQGSINGWFRSKTPSQALPVVRTNMLIL